MQALAWWLIPIVATVLAVVWLSFRARPRPPVDAHDSMEERERFRAAMERPLAPPRRTPRPGETEQDRAATDG